MTAHHENATEALASGPYRPGVYQPQLDGLRALSIVAVLLYHNERIVPGGYLGVDLFFVLSGFLITSLLFAEYRQNGRIDLRRFYLRRALRLFPALAALLGVATAFALLFPNAAQSPKILRSVGYSILYLNNWADVGDSLSLGPLGHTWSLAIEEQFYLLWPLCLVGLLRLTEKRGFLVRAIVALALASALWRAVLFLTGSTVWRLYIGTDSRADSLLIGSAFAICMSSRPDGSRFGNTRATRWLALAGGAGVLALVATKPPEWAGHYLGGFFCVALSAAMLIVGILSNPDWWLARFLSVAPLVWLGRLSYSLYLWHYPIFGFIKTDRLDLGRAQVMTLRVLVTFAAAIASYFLIERPFLTLKKRIGGGSRDPDLRDRSVSLEAQRLYRAQRVDQNSDSSKPLAHR